MRDISSINQGLQIPIADRLTEKIEGAYFYITNEFLKAGAKKSYYIVNPSPSVTCVESDILMTRTGNTGMIVTGVEGVFHNNFFKITYKDSIARFFLYYFLTHHRTQHTLLKLAGTSTIPDLNHGDFYRISIAVPTLPEQRKIADFLTAVDGRIGQLIQKKALLEDYKKGVMQQLFTQAIRFKDDQGNEFPDWEEKKLGEVAKCLDNLRRPVNATDREKMKGDIPYYGANGIQGYVNDFIFDEDLTLLAEDGGNFGEFANRPIAQRVTGKAWVNNHAHILRANPSDMTPAFLFHSLVHKDIRKYINGSSRAKLNKGDMLMIAMTVPEVPEQTKIADFLSAIDRKIESVATQITETQTFKRGLLQQMFV
jgi:type I restriction enzyme S subunit